MPWGWQFAAFQAPAVVFLGAVWALGARRWGTSIEAHRQFATMVLGLLGFAFLACLIRTGGYALRLGPALYAAPVMLRYACDPPRHGFAPPDPTLSASLLSVRGYVLSGLAFAMAWPRPPALASQREHAGGRIARFAPCRVARVDRHPCSLWRSGSGRRPPGNYF
jgi:hypothetical protein